MAEQHLVGFAHQLFEKESPFLFINENICILSNNTWLDQVSWIGLGVSVITSGSVNIYADMEQISVT